ncbi:MAG: cysteine dioxygenase family protein [Planctomycetes bacterium]|nr:cysteine dioxygenase family protein [Planctomycetota bacterium]
MAVANCSDSACVCARSAVPKLAELIDYLDGLKGQADLGKLAKLLSGLKLTRKDVAPACVFGEKGYRRNRISGSDHYELLALCWRSGDRTPIHDHQGVSCAFRVVEGTGTEIRFAGTPSGLVCPTNAVSMKPGYVCAAEEADIHQVANMQAPGEDLITLHIYSPPIRKMNTYEFAASIPADVANKYAGLTERAGRSAGSKKPRTGRRRTSAKAKASSAKRSRK